MKNSIYDVHQSAFNDVNAYVVFYENNDGIENIAKIAFKRGKTGSVKCFLHVLGEIMVSGSAGGYGYDKPSAAFYDAAQKHYDNIKMQGHMDSMQSQSKDKSLIAKQLLDAAKAGNGSSNWERELKEQGLTILQAV